jgi:hypothetical protein
MLHLLRRGLVFLLPLFWLSHGTSGQVLSVTGTVRDTLLDKGLPYAVAMAVRLDDSVLTAFTRTDTSGYFRLDALPVDTYQVVISHPLFGDHTYVVMGNAAEPDVDLGVIALPPKSYQLNEFTVYGYADPVYYKGDTLVYTADSFQVKPNAVVEDLLKKLPGIRVDNQGKIFSQGKAVDQVLVDGDEFFGSDPTVATRNLNASSVESVQVYDKKNENASDGQGDDLLKVMDLRLKEDAKKGYFGKVSGAHDPNDFYESEALVNRFNGKQKISLFGLRSNTKRASFGWNDIYTYGLSDEQQSYTDGDDTYYYTDNSSPNGIPRTFKTGAYFTDQLTRSTKVTLNYSYRTADLESASGTSSMYFLPDTTYNTTTDATSSSSMKSHALNLTVEQKIDSLNTLELRSRFSSGRSEQSAADGSRYYTSEDTLTRATTTNNGSDNTNTQSVNSLKWTRNFNNRDRKLVAFYSYTASSVDGSGALRSSNEFYDGTTAGDSINQQKTTDNSSGTHFASATYTEPLSKKVKLEFSGDFARSDGSQDKKTYDVVNGLPSVENPVYSNSFENESETRRLGLKFIYEVKKQTLSLGAAARNMQTGNHNLVTDERLSQEVTKVLPSLSYRYKFSDNKSLSFRYSTSTRLPDLNQLQPVPDNSDPNTIRLGNPGLLPSYTHNFSAWMNSYRVVSGSYAFGNVWGSVTQNAFSNDLTYDNIGRTLIRTVNVDGNFSGGAYASGSLPVFSKWLQIRPDVQYSFTRQAAYVNGEQNITKISNPHVNLALQHDNDSLGFELRVGYSFYTSSSSLNPESNQRYTTFDYGAELEVQLPWKLRLETDASYSADNRRYEGYNLRTLLWNASLKKTLLKNENLVVSLEGMDLLDEGITTSRVVQDNVITDEKSNVVGRYILLKVLFKFNSKREKDGSDEE